MVNSMVTRHKLHSYLNYCGGFINKTLVYTFLSFDFLHIETGDGKK